MAAKTHSKKKVPGKILGDFVYQYRYFIKPFISRGDFESSAQQMNDACTNYQVLINFLSRTVCEKAYEAYKRAVSIFSDLLDKSVSEVKDDFANLEKRRTLLSLLDREVSIIDSVMRDNRNKDYLKSEMPAMEKTATF